MSEDDYKKAYEDDDERPRIIPASLQHLARRIDEGESRLRKLERVTAALLQEGRETEAKRRDKLVKLVMMTAAIETRVAQLEERADILGNLVAGEKGHNLVIGELQLRLPPIERVTTRLLQRMEQLEKRVQHRLGAGDGHHLNPDITLLELTQRLGTLERKLEQ